MPTATLSATKPNQLREKQSLAYQAQNAADLIAHYEKAANIIVI
jgi:hypothetical protein